MNSLVIIFLIFVGILLAAICLVGMYIGIDLRKGIGWLLVLCGFLLGVLLGLSNGNFSDAVVLGFGVGIIVAYGGEMRRRQKALFAPPSDAPRKKRKSCK